MTLQSAEISRIHFFGIYCDAFLKPSKKIQVNNMILNNKNKNKLSY